MDMKFGTVFVKEVPIKRLVSQIRSKIVFSIIGTVFLTVCIIEERNSINDPKTILAGTQNREKMVYGILSSHELNIVANCLQCLHLWIALDSV